jgi:hypothetical protein
MLLKLSPRLMRLHVAMPPQLQVQVHSIIFKLKANRLPLQVQYVLFRQLWANNPRLTRSLRVMMTISIQAQAGLLDGLDSMGQAEATVYTSTASSIGALSGTGGMSITPLTGSTQPSIDSLLAIRDQLQCKLDSLNEITDISSNELQNYLQWKERNDNVSVKRRGGVHK